MANLKPNLFRLATRELSQDGFFAWLLQWANGANSEIDEGLTSTAQDFVRLLIDQRDDYIIDKVQAGRQWKNIDVWAKVNDGYFICIEDKTNTGAHSGQLERYKKIVDDEYKDNSYKTRLIYLKTGNESLTTLRSILDKGYSVIDRKQILKVLCACSTQNAILNDFREYLTEIEDITNSFTLIETVKTERRAAEGFYLKLQELIPETTDWGYVPNQSGGFLGFWFSWVQAQGYNLYIQIENDLKGKINVAIKIGGWIPNLDMLREVFSGLEIYSQKKGISIKKPSRYSSGKASTVAIMQNVLPDKGEVEFIELVESLSMLQTVLNEYTNDSNRLSKKD